MVNPYLLLNFRTYIISNQVCISTHIFWIVVYLDQHLGVDPLQTLVEICFFNILLKKRWKREEKVRNLMQNLAKNGFFKFAPEWWASVLFGFGYLNMWINCQVGLYLVCVALLLTLGQQGDGVCMVGAQQIKDQGPLLMNKNFPWVTSVEKEKIWFSQFKSVDTVIKIDVAQGKFYFKNRGPWSPISLVQSEMPWEVLLPTVTSGDRDPCLSIVENEIINVTDFFNISCWINRE